MKRFRLFPKDPDHKIWKYALLHALIYSLLITLLAFFIMLIFAATPWHLNLQSDWILLGTLLAVIFIFFFVFILFDELYIEGKYQEEVKSKVNGSQKIDKITINQPFNSQNNINKVNNTKSLSENINKSEAVEKKSVIQASSKKKH